MNCGDMSCGNELSLCKVCVKKACIECLQTCSQVSNKFCAQEVNAGQLNVLNETANNICVSGELSAGQLSANNLNANTLCAQSGTINTLCVNNLTAGNLVPFTKYRSTVNYRRFAFYWQRQIL